jgi:hypothetical protein
VAQGGDYHAKEGRGCGICLGHTDDALLFTLDGDATNTSLRRADDTPLALEVNHRKFELNGSLSLWHCKGHAEWACRFCLNPDGTLSPAQNAEVVVGVAGTGKTELVLVDKGDEARRLIFRSAASGLGAFMAQLQVQLRV